MVEKRNILDLSQFEKIEDIIYYDEPILSHYKRNDRDFLFYLVDTENEVDTFLVLEVSADSFFDYLTKRTSLRSLIVENKNISYIITQDFNGSILSTEVTEALSLSDNFLPLEDSFLEYKPIKGSYHYDFIEEYNNKYYLENLREDAFYIKFSPNNKKYSDTIGLNELTTNLLLNLSKSFKSFLKADFFNSFEKIQTDQKKLQRTLALLLPNLDFRMVDLRFGSFEVGLAVDKVMKRGIENEKVKEWAIDIGYKYKEIVLDEDYDGETVDKIMDSYNEDDRRKIFDPIFKITEDPNYNFQVRSSKKEKYTSIKIKDKSVIEKIAPKKLGIKTEDDKDYEIVNVTTLIDKNNLKNTTIKLENTLFSSTDNTSFTLTNSDFSKYGYKLDFEVSIPLNIKTEKNTITLSANYEEEYFEEVYSSVKMNEGVKKIVSKIYEYILNKDW